jgi:hypothetical protein
MEQHERALDAYLDQIRGDPEVLAVVVVGSVARGTERADSDVDVYLVVTDEGFARATAERGYAWTERHDVDYPGSYIDIKLASPAYLRRAAAVGDDPTRASFDGARAVWSRDASIQDLVDAVPRVDEAVWGERVRSHLAQVRLYGGYFLRQADERGDPFLAAHAGIHLALAAARTALAEARTLMPGPKYVSTLVRSVPTPTGFVPAWDRVVARADRASGDALLDVLEAWLGDRLRAEDTLSVFIRDNELAWLQGTVPAEFR